MTESRYRLIEDVRKRAEPDPSNANNPNPFFHWALARLLVGEPLDVCEPQLRRFQQAFPIAEMDFTNLRRRVCLGASAMLLGLPLDDSAREALVLAHRMWDAPAGKGLEIAIEACAAAALAGDETELTLWWERAMTRPAVDWVELFEETLFAFDPASAALDATCVARVAIEGIFGATLSAAPVVCALWHRTRSVASLADRAAIVDELVFGPEGEKALLKLGRPSFEVLDSELRLTLKVTGRGPFSPGGYVLAPFAYELGAQLDRFGVRLGRLPEPERTLKMTAYDAALTRTDHGMLFRLQLGRGVELSPQDEAAFRARILHSWEHVRRSSRAVHAEARVEIIR